MDNTAPDPIFDIEKAIEWLRSRNEQLLREPTPDSVISQLLERAEFLANELKQFQAAVDATYKWTGDEQSILTERSKRNQYVKKMELELEQVQREIQSYDQELTARKENKE